jgi:hypothetical protein
LLLLRRQPLPHLRHPNEMTSAVFGRDRAR